MAGLLALSSNAKNMWLTPSQSVKEALIKSIRHAGLGPVSLILAFARFRFSPE